MFLRRPLVALYALYALLAVLVVPTGAEARGTRTSPTAHAAAAAQLSGTVTTVGWGAVTIQTAGRRMGVINAMSATASAIMARDYPYVYGGGHAEAGMASVGSRGPGYTGHTLGLDCSGSVVAVLSGAGLWPAGSPVPNDAGVIAQLRQEGLIARGPGKPPYEVTLYDNPGIHIFMNIDGRFFGTSDGGGGGSRKGGAGWLNDGAPDATSRAYHEWHLLPSVLRERTTYGHSLTLQIAATDSALGQLAATVQVGDRVTVGYGSSPSGAIVLRSLVFAGQASTAGTVTAIASDGSTVTLATPTGETLVLTVPPGSSTGSSLELGDQVQAVYTGSGSTLALRAVTVTGAPVTSEMTGTIATIAADASSFTLQDASGGLHTFATGTSPDMLSGVQIGDQAGVTYLTLGGTLLAQQLTDNGPVSPADGTAAATGS